MKKYNKFFTGLLVIYILIVAFVGILALLGVEIFEDLKIFAKVTATIVASTISSYSIIKINDWYDKKTEKGKYMLFTFLTSINIVLVTLTWVISVWVESEYFYQKIYSSLVLLQFFFIAIQISSFFKNIENWVSIGTFSWVYTFFIRTVLQIVNIIINAASRGSESIFSEEGNSIIYRIISALNILELSIISVVLIIIRYYKKENPQVNSYKVKINDGWIFLIFIFMILNLITNAGNIISSAGY